MLEIPKPVSAVPTIIRPLRLNLRVRGLMSPPCTITPSSPTNAKTQPLSLSDHPKPPSLGPMEVNRMKVPCIMVKPIRKRKFTLTREEIVGIRITEEILEKVSPNWETGDFCEIDLEPLGKLSGSLKNASIRAIADMALEKRHGSR